ncbi:MAG: hypothetical protein IPK62_15130 [Bacteroidetes bacterium]|nr:hypothetical protein [Bacteroidota bacterium]
MLSFENKQFTPYAPLPHLGIFYKTDGLPSTTINSTEIGLECRFAYREEFIEGNYYRTSLGTSYPIIKTYIGVGLKNVLGSNSSYTKLRLTISDNLKLKRAGSIYYNIFAGKIFGTQPYPILEVHPGNEFNYYNSTHSV